MSASEAETARQIRAVIVDDEVTARRGLRSLLLAQRDVAVVGEAGNVDEAVEVIERERPDLVLLDVQMPQGDGFDVLQRLSFRPLPAIVFITAYDQYALRAFEVSAVDYLLKPFDDARFASAVSRARESIRLREGGKSGEDLKTLFRFLETHRANSSDAGEDEPLRDRLAVKTGGEIVLLKIEEIDWVEAEGDYMVLHVAGKSHLLRETMQRLESRLDPKRFVRIHRSTLVNLDRVRKLTPSFVGEYSVVLHDGTKLKLSRSYHGRLQEKLKHAL